MGRSGLVTRVICYAYIVDYCYLLSSIYTLVCLPLDTERLQLLMYWACRGLESHHQRCEKSDIAHI